MNVSVAELSRRESVKHVNQTVQTDGYSRILQVPRTELELNSSFGGSKGYPVYLRKVIVNYTSTCGQIAACKVFNVFASSIFRWTRNLIPKLQRGNKERAVLTGCDQLLLATAIFLNPTSDADEICAYIYNNGGGLYSHNQVYQRFKELRVVRKRVSIEVFAAFTPRNLLKARLFWQMPPPLGINGIHRRQFIDIDKT